MIDRHKRIITRFHTKSKRFIDKVSLNKAIEILEPYYPPEKVLNAHRKIPIRKMLRNGEPMNSGIYTYQFL